MKRLSGLLLIFQCLSLFSQSRSGNDFHFHSSNKWMRLQMVSHQTFRVTYSTDGSFPANESWMVMQYKFPVVSLKTSFTAKEFQIQSDSIKISVDLVRLRVSVYDRRGNLVYADADNEKLPSEKTEQVSINKRLLTGEHFFGLGERMDFIDQLHKKLKLNVGRGKGLPHEVGAYNILEASYAPVPLLLSTRGYGIFFHNAFPSEWDLGFSNPQNYSFSATGGSLDYYFFYGPDFAHILQSYTGLTGKAPLLPKFAHGLHMGTYSGGTWSHEEKTSDAYVIELARKLRELGIPVDLLWLDSTWRIFGKVGGKGATSFEWRSTFQNPRAMFDSLYAMNFSMVGLHLRPRFDNGDRVKLLDTAQKLGFTYPEKDNPGEFVNFFDSNAVNWWWKHGVMRVASLGAKFLKTDEGSAFGGLANESDKTGPTGKEIEALHNLFPIAYAKAPFEKFQSYNGIRGLNHTREGYAGIQRYPFIFAGDWPSEWQYFAPVIKAGINLGLSGVGYWGHCMGGFEHNADPELYMRWCQFGMFSPVAMLFGMDHPGYKEPWNYGQEAFLNFKKYDSLRYTLLPYLYTAAYQQYKTGLPIMQALVLQNQADPNVYDIGDQYYWGRHFMVCPVTVKGAKTRSVYLPEGKWFDFWTGKQWDGHQYIHVVTPPDTMPIFVKAGAIIPQQEVQSFVGEKKIELLKWKLYPGEGRSEWYDDDGKTLNYQKGNFTHFTLTQSWKTNNCNIDILPVANTSTTEIRYWEFEIPTIRQPEMVALGDEKLTPLKSGSNLSDQGFLFDPKTGKTYVRIHLPLVKTRLQVWMQ